MIVGFAINKIESARHVSLEELPKYRNINVNYDINLRNLSAVKPPMGPDKVLRIEYSITINYFSPSIGFIRFEGFCDYAGGNIEKILKEWEGGRPDVAVQNEAANNVMARIIPLAMLISQSLCLPPATPLPVINFQKVEAEKDKFDQYHA
ncbi:hypothetical protein Mtc_1641 [Methanocella conradii HZ254]|uniref:Preprotein translocase subunit SecB n=1 Tax=Methanocella conradii (strain DSM 24694 / JCM 17849 / CGMCC 1.5162 / HZ254) TaxID=1041930 RepID=H8I7Z0_METCZ|nr:hypothetical protein [Methanocella conradii]AFD00390.1 hypothetical protein Mtc_1641 [Methanocella conradii HZ254]MDI6895787.1 hypothetical protein [Methanocella conradii]